MISVRCHSLFLPTFPYVSQCMQKPRQYRAHLAKNDIWIIGFNKINKTRGKFFVRCLRVPWEIHENDS